jgi:hypothetical protein
VSTNYTLFVDLDGVLADFDAGVKAATGKLPSEMRPKQMWPRLARTPQFYAELDWMPDGRELWEYVASHDPIVLTGLPMGKWAEPQKREWCRRELGAEVEVITCMSRRKPAIAAERTGSGATPVIVDDRDRIREAWEEMGGIFIHHKSARQSIAELKELGL